VAGSIAPLEDASRRSSRPTTRRWPAIRGAGGAPRARAAICCWSNHAHAARAARRDGGGAATGLPVWSAVTLDPLATSSRRRLRCAARLPMRRAGLLVNYRVSKTTAR
jgi:hypothetical protein